MCKSARYACVCVKCSYGCVCYRYKVTFSPLIMLVIGRNYVISFVCGRVCVCRAVVVVLVVYSISQLSAHTISLTE